MSDSASCAASWASPLALVRCSSLKDGRPSSCFGHSMPSGRSAQVVRTTSSRSQRPQSFCHSRAYGSMRLRQNMKRVHFIIEAEGVVAQTDRARLTQFALDGRRELVFGQALRHAGLRQDAASRTVRQVIR